jgi:hypothetical protein
MQVLITTGVSAATNANAIYLPYDKAPVPFGDPLAATVTAATPTVVTVPGYLPTNGDAVSLSVAGTSGFLTSLAGLSTISAQLNTTYYVSSASGATFTLSTVKATAASPAFVYAEITTLGQFGGQVFVHLLSNQPDGTTLPFKPNNTVLAMNGGVSAVIGTYAGTQSFAPLTLFGAPDVSSILATGTYGAPLGPNGSASTGWAVIATIGFGCPKLVTLNYDWIVASGSSSTLILLQN